VAVELVADRDAAGNDAVGGAVVGGVDLNPAARAQALDAAVALLALEALADRGRAVDEALGLAVHDLGLLAR
jgi:hypothetical protein